MSHKITYITQDNPQYTKLQKNKNILCAIKTQKRLEPKVDGLVLKSTRYAKQSINHTVLFYSTSIIIYNKPTRCNSGSIVFINNYKCALHVSDALCIHHQEHYKL